MWPIRQALAVASMSVVAGLVAVIAAMLAVLGFPWLEHTDPLPVAQLLNVLKFVLGSVASVGALFALGWPSLAAPSSALLGGVVVLPGCWLVADWAAAGPGGQELLDEVDHLVEGQAVGGVFGSVRCWVMNRWAAVTRVRCRCQPVNERPSKWSRPSPVFSSR